MDRVNDTSRRGAIKAGLGVLAGTAAMAIGSRAQAQDQKIAQTLVQYQTTPKDGAECDKCVNWVAPNACKIVGGTINPKGWCVAYAPKDG